ncbi:MAG: hypothetical protein IV100_24920 [Myxococcales bacterium]|nr:hypothetical protein [Myxococcales bacterium]
MRRLAALLIVAPLACENGEAGLSPALGGADVIGASGDATDGSDVGTSDAGDGVDAPDIDTVDTDSTESDVWIADDTLAAEDVGAFEDVPAADDVNVADDVNSDDVEPSEDVDAESDVAPDDVAPLDDTGPLVDVPPIEDTSTENDAGGAVDTSPDEDTPAPLDVPPVDDVQIEPDAGPADVAPPLGPETAWFRLNDMDFVAPALCLPGPGSCLDITSFANTYLGPVFSDTVEPTDIVLSFTQPEGSTTAAVELGEGVCVRSGDVIVSCGIGDPPPPASFDATVSTVDACLGVAAPCFGTSEALPSLAVQVGTFQIGLSNVEVAGRIIGAASDRSIEDGLLQGFLPEKIAKTLTVDAPVFGVLSVAQLLAKAPLVSVNGQPGWMVEFSFAATEVPGP